MLEAGVIPPLTDFIVKANQNYFGEAATELMRTVLGRLNASSIHDTA